MQRQHRKGFTLIEVLIVVTILGILAATVLPQFSASSAEAQQATLMHNLKILRSQIAMYKSQHGSYPAQTSTVSQDFKNAMLLATDAKGISTGSGANSPLKISQKTSTAARAGLLRRRRS